MTRNGIASTYYLILLKVSLTVYVIICQSIEYINLSFPDSLLYGYMYDIVYLFHFLPHFLTCLPPLRHLALALHLQQYTHIEYPLQLYHTS